MAGKTARGIFEDAEFESFIKTRLTWFSETLWLILTQSVGIFRGLLMLPKFFIKFITIFLNLRQNFPFSKNFCGCTPNHFFKLTLKIISGTLFSKISPKYTYVKNYLHFSLVFIKIFQNFDVRSWKYAKISRNPFFFFQCPLSMCTWNEGNVVWNEKPLRQFSSNGREIEENCELRVILFVICVFAGR